MTDTTSLIDEKSKRPSVTIHAQTAVTTGIEVDSGDTGAWIVVSHDKITITPKGLEVEIKP